MSETTDKNGKNLLVPTIVCFLAAMFYLYEFILQVSPSVMTTELMRDLRLNAASLGVMAAFYFYSYTAMQIPAGLLYDRFGPRRLITIALTICACGAFFFGLTDNVVMASAGRFFMGIGSAFSFIGSLLLISRWFPPQYFAFLAGVVQLMSSIGAIAGQVPIATAVESFGWRHTIMTVSIAGFVLALIVWLVVRDYPPEVALKDQNVGYQGGELNRLKQVCRRSQTWWIGLYSFTAWAPIAVFAELWGVPYLNAAYHLTTTQASVAFMVIWLAIGIGSPLIGWWSDFLGKRTPPLAVASLIGLIGTSGLLFLHSMSLPIIYIMLLLLGLAATGQSLSFALVKENNLPAVTGTAIGFNNMAVVAGGALFQPLTGFILHWHWNGYFANGAPVYAAADYRTALIVMPLCYLVGFLISIFKVRETNCKILQQQPDQKSAGELNKYHREAIPA